MRLQWAPDRYAYIRTGTELLFDNLEKQREADAAACKRAAALAANQECERVLYRPERSCPPARVWTAPPPEAQRKVLPSWSTIFAVLGRWMRG